LKKKIVAVGKIAPFLKEAQEHYLKRLPKASVVEVKKGKNREEEGKLLLRRAEGFIVALDERGKELSSVQFSKFLERYPKITFLIGGADGLSEEVKKRADFLLSLSKMTLQHDIARIVLLEQIYRANEILKGSPYHRE